jgi:hypothetical protein
MPDRKKAPEKTGASATANQSGYYADFFSLRRFAKSHSRRNA